MEHNQKFAEYIQLYLCYLDCINDSIDKDQRFSSHIPYTSIDDIKGQLSPEVYSQYKLRNTMAITAGLELNASQKAKKFLEENEELKKTKYGDLLMNQLIPRSELFDSLANRRLDTSFVFIDEPAPINNLEQLVGRLRNQPMLLDFWGTWCGSCRYQFKYNESLKPFLSKRGISMVYIAKEYTKNREDWKKVIAAYDLKGYHFMINDQFVKDLRNNSVTIDQYPTYILIDSKGKITVLKDLFPDDGDKFREQIATYID